MSNPFLDPLASEGDGPLAPGDPQGGDNITAAGVSHSNPFYQDLLGGDWDDPPVSQAGKERPAPSSNPFHTDTLVDFDPISTQQTSENALLDFANGDGTVAGPGFSGFDLLGGDAVDGSPQLCDSLIDLPPPMEFSQPQSVSGRRAEVYSTPVTNIDDLLGLDFSMDSEMLEEDDFSEKGEDGNGGLNGVDGPFDFLPDTKIGGEVSYGSPAPLEEAGDEEPPQLPAEPPPPIPSQPPPVPNDPPPTATNGLSPASADSQLFVFSDSTSPASSDLLQSAPHDSPAVPADQVAVEELDQPPVVPTDPPYLPTDPSAVPSDQPSTVPIDQALIPKDLHPSSQKDPPACIPADTAASVETDHVHPAPTDPSPVSNDLQPSVPSGQPRSVPKGPPPPVPVDPAPHTFSDHFITSELNETTDSGVEEGTEKDADTSDTTTTLFLPSSDPSDNVTLISVTSDPPAADSGWANNNTIHKTDITVTSSSSNTSSIRVSTPKPAPRGDRAEKKSKEVPGAAVVTVSSGRSATSTRIQFDNSSKETHVMSPTIALPPPNAFLPTSIGTAANKSSKPEEDEEEITPMIVHRDHQGNKLAAPSPPETLGRQVFKRREVDEEAKRDLQTVLSRMRDSSRGRKNTQAEAERDSSVTVEEEIVPVKLTRKEADTAREVLTKWKDEDSGKTVFTPSSSTPAKKSGFQKVVGTVIDVQTGKVQLPSNSVFITTMAVNKTPTPPQNGVSEEAEESITPMSVYKDHLGNKHFAPSPPDSLGKQSGLRKLDAAAKEDIAALMSGMASRSSRTTRETSMDSGVAVNEDAIEATVLSKEESRLAMEAVTRWLSDEVAPTKSKPSLFQSVVQSVIHSADAPGTENREATTEDRTVGQVSETVDARIAVGEEKMSAASVQQSEQPPQQSPQLSVSQDHDKSFSVATTPPSLQTETFKPSLPEEAVSVSPNDVQSALSEAESTSLATRIDISGSKATTTLTTTRSSVISTSTSSKATSITSSSEAIPATSSSKATPTTESSRGTSITSSSKDTPPTSSSKDTPTTSSSKATPNTSSSKATPTTSSSKATPTTSSSKATPTTSSSKDTPATSSSKATPTTSSSKAIPTTSSKKATPTTASSKSTPDTTGTFTHTSDTQSPKASSTATSRNSSVPVTSKTASTASSRSASSITPSSKASSSTTTSSPTSGKHKPLSSQRGLRAPAKIGSLPPVASLSTRPVSKLGTLTGRGGLASSLSVSMPSLVFPSASRISQKVEYEKERNDHTPFLVEVLKGIVGLGIKVKVNDEGHVEVTEVQRNSPVFKNGNVRVGDFVLSINTTELRGVSEGRVQQVLRLLPRGLVKLVVSTQPPPPLEAQGVESTGLNSPKSGGAYSQYGVRLSPQPFSPKSSDGQAPALTPPEPGRREEGKEEHQKEDTPINTTAASETLTVSTEQKDEDEEKEDTEVDDMAARKLSKALSPRATVSQSFNLEPAPPPKPAPRQRVSVTVSPSPAEEPASSDQHGPSPKSERKLTPSEAVAAASRRPSGRDDDLPEPVLLATNAEASQAQERSGPAPAGAGKGQFGSSHSSHRETTPSSSVATDSPRDEEEAPPVFTAVAKKSVPVPAPRPRTRVLKEERQERALSPTETRDHREKPEPPPQPEEPQLNVSAGVVHAQLVTISPQQSPRESTESTGKDASPQVTRRPRSITSTDSDLASVRSDMSVKDMPSPTFVSSRLRDFADPGMPTVEDQAQNRKFVSSAARMFEQKASESAAVSPLTRPTRSSVSVSSVVRSFNRTSDEESGVTMRKKSMGVGAGGDQGRPLNSSLFPASHRRKSMPSPLRGAYSMELLPQSGDVCQGRSVGSSKGSSTHAGPRGEPAEVGQRFNSALKPRPGSSNTTSLRSIVNSRDSVFAEDHTASPPSVGKTRDSWVTSTRSDVTLRPRSSVHEPHVSTSRSKRASWSPQSDQSRVHSHSPSRTILTSQAPSRTDRLSSLPTVHPEQPEHMHKAMRKFDDLLSDRRALEDLDDDLPQVSNSLSLDLLTSRARPSTKTEASDVKPSQRDVQSKENTSKATIVLPSSDSPAVNVATEKPSDVFLVEERQTLVIKNPCESTAESGRAAQTAGSSDRVSSTTEQLQVEVSKAKTNPEAETHTSVAELVVKVADRPGEMASGKMKATENRSAKDDIPSTSAKGEQKLAACDTVSGVPTDVSELRSGYRTSSNRRADSTPRKVQHSQRAEQDVSSVRPTADIKAAADVASTKENIKEELARPSEKVEDVSRENQTSSSEQNSARQVAKDEPVDDDDDDDDEGPPPPLPGVGPPPLPGAPPPSLTPKGELGDADLEDLEGLLPVQKDVTPAPSLQPSQDVSRNPPLQSTQTSGIAAWKEFDRETAEVQRPNTTSTQDRASENSHSEAETRRIKAAPVTGTDGGNPVQPRVLPAGSGENVKADLQAKGVEEEEEEHGENPPASDTLSQDSGVQDEDMSEDGLRFSQDEFPSNTSGIDAVGTPDEIPASVMGEGQTDVDETVKNVSHVTTVSRVTTVSQSSVPSLTLHASRSSPDPTGSLHDSRVSHGSAAGVDEDKTVSPRLSPRFSSDGRNVSGSVSQASSSQRCSSGHKETERQTYRGGASTTGDADAGVSQADDRDVVVSTSTVLRDDADDQKVVQSGHSVTGVKSEADMDKETENTAGGDLISNSTVKREGSAEITQPSTQSPRSVPAPLPPTPQDEEDEEEDEDDDEEEEEPDEDEEQAAQGDSSSSSSDSTAEVVSSRKWCILDQSGSLFMQGPGGGGSVNVSRAMLRQVASMNPGELAEMIKNCNEELDSAELPKTVELRVVSARGLDGAAVKVEVFQRADYFVQVTRVLTKDSCLLEADLLLAVDGRSLKNRRPARVYAQLDDTGPKGVLLTARGVKLPASAVATVAVDAEAKQEGTATLPATQPPPTPTTTSTPPAPAVQVGAGVYEVTMVKGTTGVGLSLEGGKGSPRGDMPILIKRIFKGGPAEKCGHLQTGDEILAVNGKDYTALGHYEAWNHLKAVQDGQILLRIRRKE